MARLSVSPVRKGTLAEDICEQLTKSMASGELAPGQKLPTEQELMSMFSVGRTTIREALRSLALLGVLETRQGDGTYIRKGTPEALAGPIAWQALANVSTGLEVLEARRVVETGLVELAASRATAEDMKLLEQQLGEMDASVGDPVRFAKLDLQFHVTLAEIAGNKLMLEFITRLRELLHKYILEDLKSPGVGELSAAQHRQVVEAIRKGKVNSACQAMRRHLIDVSDRLKESISDEQA